MIASYVINLFNEMLVYIGTILGPMQVTVIGTSKQISGNVKLIYS